MQDASLNQILDELLAEGERPDAERLAEAVRRHPEWREELLDFYAEWVLQEELAVGDGEGAPPPGGGRAMGLALERWSHHPALAALQHGDPFAGRPPSELGRVALDLGLDKTLLAKLRGRKIVAETIPQALQEDLGSALGVPPARLAAHFAKPALIPAGLSFKSKDKPRVVGKETFDDAVERSLLSDEDKARWLKEQ